MSLRKLEGEINQGADLADTDDSKAATLRMESETRAAFSEESGGGASDDTAVKVVNPATARKFKGSSKRSKRKSKELRQRKERGGRGSVTVSASLSTETGTELTSGNEDTPVSDSTIQIDMKDSGGEEKCADDSVMEDTSLNDDDEEEELPKTPRVDGYFIVLGIVLVSTILGVIVYFTIADIVDPPVLITKESIMPIWFKDLNFTEAPVVVAEVITTTEPLLSFNSTSNFTQSAPTTPGGMSTTGSSELGDYGPI